MSKKKTKLTINKVLGNYPGRTLHRLGTALGGIWVTSSILNLFWPLPDQVMYSNSLSQLAMKDITVPKKTINLLLLGVKNSQSALPQNNKSQTSQGSLERLALIKINYDQPIRLIEIPTELKVILPGSQTPHTLSKVYEKGGIAMQQDIVSKLLRIPKEEPQRYLILNTNNILKIINNIGGIQVYLNTSFAIDKGTKENSIFLPAAVQTLDGLQVSKVLLYKGNSKNKGAMKSIKKSMLKGFWKQLRSPEGTANILNLSEELVDSTKTNLVKQELLSLFAAFIKSSQPPILEEIPLSAFTEN